MSTLLGPPQIAATPRLDREMQGEPVCIVAQDILWCSSASRPGQVPLEAEGVNALFLKEGGKLHASDSFLTGGQFQGHPGCFSAVQAELNPNPYSGNVNNTLPIGISFFHFVFLLPHFHFIRSPSSNYWHKSTYLRLCFQKAWAKLAMGPGPGQWTSPLSATQ